MPHHLSRRESLKAMGIIVGGTFFPRSPEHRNEHGEPLLLPDEAEVFQAVRPVTAITLGAGARGNVYGDYATAYPDQLKIVGIAEPIPIRQERYSQKHKIAAENRFVTWENDQPDHYVTNIVFANGVTASFSMEAFTPWGGRRTRVMGSMGFIEGDMEQMQVYDFHTGERTVFESKALDVDRYAGDGHGGGDWRLVANWLRAVAAQDGSLLSSTIDVSIESHIMGFAAEKRRRLSSVERVRTS